nr:PP2C family protein-serine/threonine phosphatase [Nocardioides perillae]
MAALTAVMTVALVVEPDELPLTMLMVPLVLGNLWLGPRRLPWFTVAVLCAVALVVSRQSDITVRTAGAVLVMFVLGFIILMSAFRRSRLGVAGLRGESMLVDLRDRILNQGRLPDLPPGWGAQLVLRSAGGTPFAGDFVVAAPRTDDDRLELVLVDVSGKGEQAGTRALLLSGAFGGLLSALPADRFLPAANDYLLRQDWEEGFATAVHLAVDLRSGDFEVRTAGHPPAVQLSAGSGRWRVLDSDGPLLGVLGGAEYAPWRGHLARGDALMVYTDGLVEGAAGRDISLGIDRLLGTAERELQRGLDGVADRLVRKVGVDTDDRALLLLYRL